MSRRREEIRRVTAELAALLEEKRATVEALIAGLAASGSEKEEQEGEGESRES